MIIFPAVDIRKGKCVRLTKGDFEQETIYSDDPAEMAVKWERQGAEYIHVVDLDGALAGKPVNTAVIERIVKNVAVPVQLGGGIRTLDTIGEMLKLGVSRVILGSVAVRQPDLVKQACLEYGDRIVVGIDARDGQVAVEGWGTAGGIGAAELACRMAEVGVARIIYTDISKDGTLAGVNVEATALLAQAAGIPVIASGGVGELEDIAKVRSVKSKGIEGIIVGKALYAGRFTLADAIKAAKGEE